MTRTLSDLMEFDHVIRVHADGTITDAEPGVYAPELYDGELEGECDWELMDGYSQQYGYSGPVMHASEFIGGRMERDIRENPGLYVSLVSYATDDGGDEPEGWAVAYIASVPAEEWGSDTLHLTIPMPS